MGQKSIGFIGLGNIGRPIADNISGAGFEMVVFDIAGTAERAPQGARIAGSSAEVAQDSSIVVLSLPSVEAFDSVVAEIAAGVAAPDRVVINTSTVGPAAAVAAQQALAACGIAYVDAPVSGGVQRAREGRLTVMYSGPEDVLVRVRPVLDAFSAKIFNIGSETGLGQRMKLVNNALVGTAFVAASQALAYGERGGIDMRTMLDVVNVSTGQNFVTEHYFPLHVLTETYDSAGATAIIAKDLSLFVDQAKAEGCWHVAADAVLEALQALEDRHPGGDQMLIYPFLRDGAS